MRRLGLLILVVVAILAIMFALGYTQTTQTPGEKQEQEQTQDQTQSRESEMNMQAMANMTPLDAYFSFYLNNAEQLELTDQQVAQLQKQRDTYLQRSEKERKALGAAWNDIRTLLRQDKINRAAVERRIRQNSATITNYLVLTANAHADAQNILSPEQRQQANAALSGFMRDYIAESRLGGTTGGEMRDTPEPQDTTGTRGRL